MCVCLVQVRENFHFSLYRVFFVCCRTAKMFKKKLLISQFGSCVRICRLYFLLKNLQICVLWIAKVRAGGWASIANIVDNQRWKTGCVQSRVLENNSKRVHVCRSTVRTTVPQYMKLRTNRDTLHELYKKTTTLRVRVVATVL